MEIIIKQFKDKRKASVIIKEKGGETAFEKMWLFEAIDMVIKYMWKPMFKQGEHLEN